MVALASHPPPPPHPPSPARPPPINSIRDITGVGKKHLKNQQHLDSLYRIRNDSYTAILFIQDIWRDCIGPQEKHVAFNVLKSVFLEI